MINSIAQILKPIMRGLRALTVQSYTEANVKNGYQFYIRASWPDADKITNGTPRYIYFETGLSEAIVKSRLVSYIGEEFALDIFINPSIQAGTGTTLNPRNLNIKSTNVSGVVAIKDPVVNDTGVSIDDEPEYYYGGTTPSARTGDSIPPDSERIIPENTPFLVEISSTKGSGRFSYRLEWYEGKPDLPIKTLSN